MAITATAVTIGAEPTLIAGGGGATSEGKTITIRNTGETTIWLGGDTVTDTTGFTLNAGDVISLDIKGRESIYGIAAADTPIRVLRHE